jgi:DNA-binding CsgD family transcriptional regulator
MAKRRAANDPTVRVELTPRQEEVLGLIARGKTNREIAEALGLTLDGAKWHVREILSRLSVGSREEAVERWRERRSIASRMKSWLGWPLAVGVGGAVVVVAGVAAVVALLAGGDGEPAQPAAVVPLEQPALTLAAAGEGWSVSVDEAGGLPHARDAVLAVRWDGIETEVDLVEVATGRVAARWDLGYRPTAILRPSRNEVLISHVPRGATAPAGEAELLKFSLDDPGASPITWQQPARTNLTVGLGPIALSGDERWLFYIGSHYPDCFVDGRAVNCDRARVGVIDLERPGNPVAFQEVADACWRMSPDPAASDGIVVVCDNNAQQPPGPRQWFAVTATAAMELPSPPEWLYLQTVYGAAHAFSDGSLLSKHVTDQYTATEGLRLSWHRPPFEAPFHTNVRNERVYEGMVAVQPLDEPGKLLAIMRDGRLVSIDMDTGDAVDLPYRLPPSPLDDWVLVR